MAIGTINATSDRIPLGPGTVVNEDTFSGVGSDPNDVIGAGGTITGSKYALTTQPEFPPVTVPSLPSKGTGLSASGNTVTIGPAQSGQYSDIAVSGKGALVVDGGLVVLHITGDIDLGQACEVIVKPDSSLIIFIDGNIMSKNDSSIGY